MSGFFAFWGKAAKHSWKWSAPMILSAVAWITIIVEAGMHYAPKSFSDAHKPFEAWFATDFNWEASLVLLIVAFFCYLFVGAYRVHEEAEIKHLKSQKNLKGELDKEKNEHVTLKEKARPKFTFSSSQSGCSVESRHLFLHFYRLAVTNDCLFQTITGCQGNLERIERDGKVVRDHDIDILPFASSETPDSTSKHLKPSIIYFLDVLVVSYRVNPQVVLLAAKDVKLHPAVNKLGKDVFERPGDYILSLKVSGDGITPKPARLKFKWTGDHNTSELTLAD